MKKLLIGAAALVLVAGCGQALHQAGVDQAVVGGYRLMSGEGPVMPQAAAREAAKRIGLTPEQGAKLRRIAQDHRAAMKPADLAARRAELRAILTAPTVDQARLRGFVDGVKARFEALAPERLATAQALRAELTAEQREKLAVLIEDGGARQRGRFEALRGVAAARLGLTEPQTAAADALLAKVDALRAGGASTQVRQALAAFVRTGDGAQLDAASRTLIASAPVDEAIALAASLDQRQRTAIAARVEARLASRFHR